MMSTQALAPLAPAIEAELRRHLFLYMGGNEKKAPLQGNALKYVFARLFDSELDPEDERRVFMVAAPIIRRVVITYVSSGEVLLPAKLDVPKLERWLARLETFDPQCVLMIDLHYFCGLSMKKTAAVLGLSVDTVICDLRSARAWLRAFMGWPALQRG